LALQAAQQLAPTSPTLQAAIREARILAVAWHPETLQDNGLDALGHALSVAGEREKNAAPRLVASGHLALRREGAARAQALYEQAASTDAGFAPAHFHLGNLLRVQGKLTDAVRAFEAAVAAAAGYLEAVNNLGTAYVELGRVEEGVSMLERAVAIDDNATSRVSLASALAAADRLPEALEHVKRATELSPRSAMAYGKGGELLFGKGRYEEAEQLLRKSLELKDDPSTAFTLGRVYQAQERFDQAVRLFAHVSKRVGDNPELTYQLAQSLERLGRAEEAATVFGRYLELAARRPEERDRADQVRTRLRASAEVNSAAP